jgi:hypothetical protein
MFEQEEEEIWRTIPIAPEYEASSWGRIRHKKNLIIRKTNLNHKGYPRLTIYHGREEKVHRLVASTFVPNPNPEIYTQVNHDDGDKENNRPWNLEWCTNTKNQRHAHLTGLKGHSGKVTDHRSMMAWNNTLCELLIFRTTRECSRFLNVDNRSISYLVKTKRETNGWYIDYLTDEEKITFGLKLSQPNRL